MVNFKTMDDIERDKEIEERNKFNKSIAKDINNVFEEVFKKQKKVKKKLTFFQVIGILLLILILFTILLGCIWLIKFFISGIF